MRLFGWKRNHNNGSEDMLFEEITQAVALFMNSSRIISTPYLKFFYDDKGIAQGMYLLHTTDVNILDIKKQGIRTYMFICGMHALGAGIYSTVIQKVFSKPISEFEENELIQIANAFKETDVYELGLSALGIKVQSKNKAIIDRIILVGIDTAINKVGKKAMEDQNLKDYMQVMFNAGITLVLR